MRGNYRSVLRKGPKRRRKRTVPVKTYCRRGARSARQTADAVRRSMPF